MNKIFHYYQADSVFHRINPMLKLLFLIILSVTNSLLPSIPTLMLFILLILNSFIIKCSLLKILKSSIFFIFIGLTIFVSQYFLDKDIFISSVKMIRYFNMVLLCEYFTYSTSAFDLSYAFSKYKLLREVGKIISLTLVLIPIGMDTFSNVIYAYKSRNFSIIKHPISSLSFISITVIKVYLDKITVFSDALKSRLFFI